MARIVIELIIGGRTQGEYHTFESAEVLVGRGFKNDLILSDPYASECHLRISRHARRIRIQDLSSENGTYVPKLKRSVSECTISSGDELIIGMTKIRVFTDAHKLPPARTLRQRSAYVTWMRKPAVAWCLAGILSAVSLLGGYLETNTRTSLVKLIPYPIFMLVAVLLWSGAWSFVGRLTRHKIRFSIHLSTICLILILGEVMKQAAETIGFYLNSPVIGGSVEHTGWTILSIALLYMSFSFATNMRHRTRVIASSACALLCGAAITGLLASYQNYYFTGSIPYSSILKPPIFGSPAGMSVDAFMIRVDDVFNRASKGNREGNDFAPARRVTPGKKSAS